MFLRDCGSANLLKIVFLEIALPASARTVAHDLRSLVFAMG